MTAFALSRRLLLQSAAAAPIAAAIHGTSHAAESKVAVTPFKIEVPQARLDDIQARLRMARWPDEPASDNAWTYGPPVAAMKDLVGYWLNTYDWRKQEALMNRFPHFKARVADYDVHFIHVKGSGKNPQPIILTHGWPGCFVEFLDVIEPLAFPEKHGGNADDGFNVVVASIPGFGFSSKPKGPISSTLVSRILDRVMVEGLGYKDYIAQGGDYGSGISIGMATESQYCKAAHVNLLLGAGAKQETDEERQAMERWNARALTMGGYRAIQKTKPLSLAYGMDNNPIAVAAWLFEKFQGWSQLTNGDPWSVYTRDQILNAIMTYVVTDTFGSASWMYIGGDAAAARDGEVPPRRPAQKAALGVAHFPGEVSFWPRSFAERNFKLVRWTEMQRGGHFAAFEQPKLFVPEMRAFARDLRAAKL